MNTLLKKFMKLKILFVLLTLISCEPASFEERISVSDIDVRKLQKVDMSFRKKYLEKIPSINKILGEDYAAYHLKEDMIGKNKAFFIYVVRDSYGIIHLVLIDENEKILSSMEVAGVNCATPLEREDGMVEWCDENFSIFTNDSTFNLINIKKVSEGFDENSKSLIDSTVFTYQILNGEKFQNINKKVYQVEAR